MDPAEYSPRQKLKYTLVALCFGLFGLHRFMRHQYVSGTVYSIVLFIIVMLIGQPDKIAIVTVGLSLLAILALLDALTMAMVGRFYLDERHVKISQFK